MLYVLPGDREGVVATSWRGGLAVGLAVAALLVGTLGGGASATPSGGPVAPVASASTGVCADPVPGGTVAGSLGVEGGPRGGEIVSGVGLTLGYSVGWQTFLGSNPTPIAEGCSLENLTLTSSPQGTFSVPLPLPAERCTIWENQPRCTQFTTAYGPLTLTPDGPPPPGYAISSGIAAPSGPLVANYVWELASVRLTPAGPALTVSADAPLSVTATAYMANGSLSPLVPTFLWSVTGTGWSVLAGNGAGASVLGVDGAGPGNLSVIASASDGTALESATSAVSLRAVSTTVASAGLGRTAVDVGVPTPVTVSGVGAAGYTYRASLNAGLGVGTVPMACTASPWSNGTEALACSTEVTYPLAGFAQPTANLTNGFSGATWRFPTLEVDAYPVLSAVPGAPVGYVAQPIPLALEVGNGTGVVPFAGACFDPGEANTSCRLAPGPTWHFAPSYSAPGNYTAHAWAIDASGSNASVLVPVGVVAPPRLGALALAAVNVTVGVPASVSAAWTGGALPGRFWWNVSGDAAPWGSGTLRADGTLTTTLLPSSAGVLTVTLTIVDALGTVARSSAMFAVAPAPAVEVAATSAAPAAPVPVGTGVSLTFAALDPRGQPVVGFSGSAEVTLRFAGGPVRAFVNASGVGALSPTGNGTFAVPASAWVAGLLHLTVVPLAVGTFSVGISSAALPEGSASQTFTAAPDLDHVRLFDPAVSHSDGRSNSTFWLVKDRFGNAAPGAVLSVVTVFGSSSTAGLVVAQPLPNGSSGVWVNVTPLSSSAGTLEVLDRAGVAVLGPWVIPAAPVAPRSTLGPWVALGAGLAAAAGTAAALLRPRARPKPPGPETDEAELLRLAEGRDGIVTCLRRLGPCDLAALEAAWEPGPPPAELADWLASLVADGSLGAFVGPDGRARFRLTDRAPAPRVEVDARLFEEAQRRRDAEVRGAPR